ncbi:MAG: hypothetical protein HY544_03745 [Candidatus Diapherotrites archaeon]|uniref:TaqI-like C-terminal specificity domain-containing protein n=1 Tax=Candidatus Iainarchaeum sp. TaxID=3101447 RepID=A0A8T3YLM3_9ARCH|nr:hypothetical protein [Candidatus Diapherotrites archaeon]
MVRGGGHFGFIVPDRLCFNSQFLNLRKHILGGYTLKKLWFKPFFGGVISDNVIFIIQKEKPHNASIEIAEYPNNKFEKIPQEIYSSLSDGTWFIVNEQILNIFKKIKQQNLIFELTKDNKFHTSVGFIAKPNKVTETKENSKQIKVFKGENIRRFTTRDCCFFDFKKENLAGGTQDKEKLSKQNKIFLRKTGANIIATFDSNNTYAEQSVYFIYIDKFPIIMPTDINPLVNIRFNSKLLDLSDKHTSERERLEEEIARTDAEIDDLVYKLYGITEDERKIIEDSLGGK